MNVPPWCRQAQIQLQLQVSGVGQMKVTLGEDKFRERYGYTLRVTCSICVIFSSPQKSSLHFHQHERDINNHHSHIKELIIKKISQQAHI